MAGDDALFSLSKWGGAASLAFAPGSEHTGRVELAGSEMRLSPCAEPDRTHVFRRLDGERFEYDVVLLREPETNRISVDLDFPEGLEFYRQPSVEEVVRRRIRCDPEVIDSYAVYWSGRNGSFKTGKFCHIYRPRIYDARGRSVWGRLEIAGKTMTITIPEDWLEDAAYPVVVDPVIGTQTRGALSTIDWWNEDTIIPFYLDCEMGMSKFTASSPINGLCTSYIYSYKADDLNGQAVLYSDSGNKPGTRLSRDEVIVDLDRTTPVWVPSTFSLSRQIAAGETFWYGYNAKYAIYTYYDVGSTFQKMDTMNLSDVPTTFAGLGDTWSIIMSAYFSYSNAQSYTRKMIDTIGVAGVFGKKGAFRRSCTGACLENGLAAGKSFLPRVCIGSTGISARTSCLSFFFRSIADAIRGKEANVRRLSLTRFASGVIGGVDFLQRIAGVVRVFGSVVNQLGEISTRIDMRRVMSESAMLEDRLGFFQTLIRWCRSSLEVECIASRITGFVRLALSSLSFIERIQRRIVLRKEELIFVSRITRILEFSGRLQ
jgi:hypothetical protein